MARRCSNATILLHAGRWKPCESGKSCSRRVNILPSRIPRRAPCCSRHILPQSESMNSPLGWLRASAARMKRPKADGPNSPQKTPRTAVVIVSLAVVAIFALSLWYFVQPQPLLVQGEADATRIDISARVDGRVARRPVDRGQNVTAGQILVTIDNPELLTQAQGGASRASRRAGRFQAHRGRHPRRGHRPAQGGRGLDRGQRAAGAADLRPHQAADGARFRFGPEARRGDREPRRGPTQPAGGQACLRRGRRRLHGRGTRRRQGQCGQGGRRDRDARGTGRGTDGQGAAGGAGLSHERRSRRVRVARRSAPLADRPLGCLAALRPARGSGQGIEDRRPLRGAGAGAGRQAQSPSPSARSPRAANMPVGAPRAPPATSTSGPSMSAPIPSTLCPSCGPA